METIIVARFVCKPCRTTPRSNEERARDVLVVTRTANARKEVAINRRIAQCLSLTAAVVLIWGQASPQDAPNDANGAGKLAYNSSCRTCHSIKQGDNRLGPNLHGIIGRKAGSEEYGYSPAMDASDFVWDEETLDRFIADPQAVVPGNNMKPYGGISDVAVRASIIAYLADTRQP